MKIEFDKITEQHIPHFKGGEQQFDVHMYFDGTNRIMKGQLQPGASIGYHIHDQSCEMLLITEGHATVLYDDQRYTVSAGDVHFCPKGHSHSVINDADTTLKFYAFVPEQLG